VFLAGGKFATEYGQQYSPSRWSVAQAAAPVPEPEVYAMMIAGLGFIGGVARRKQQVSG
jgi:hypothetical protein